MRVHFSTLERPKAAAKKLALQLGTSLSRTQGAIAIGLGYRSWYELSSSLVIQPSPLDQALSRSEYFARTAELVLRIASALGLPDGDVQAALAESHLTGDIAPTLRDQIAIRLACWKLKGLPTDRPRDPGGLGGLRTNSLGERRAWTRRFGRPTVVITDGGVTTVADFEFVRPRSKLEPFLPLRLYLAYGLWTEKDGSQVLFSRDYKPLWRIHKDSSVERVSPWLWISVVREEHWWDDSIRLWGDKVRSKAIEERMIGMGIRTLPILADALPLMIYDTSTHDIQMSDAADLVKAARLKLQAA